MNVMEAWKGLCTPAQLYAILSLITIVSLAIQGQIGMLIGNSVFALIWTVILGWICSSGWSGLSWFLVLFPFVLIIVVIVYFVMLAKKLEKDVKQDVAAIADDNKEKKD